MIRRIANKFGVTPNYVSMVRHGKRNNNGILEEIVREIREYEAHQRKLKRQLQHVSNQQRNADSRPDKSGKVRERDQSLIEDLSANSGNNKKVLIPQN